MGSIFNRILTQEQRDDLLSAFYISFEELLFVLTTKILLLEAIDLNPNHVNYIKRRRKIEKQIKFFTQHKSISRLLIFLFKRFNAMVQEEIEFLYKANHNSLTHLARASKNLKDLRVRQFAQYIPLKSKWKRANTALFDYTLINVLLVLGPS